MNCGIMGTRLALLAAALMLGGVTVYGEAPTPITRTEPSMIANAAWFSPVPAPSNDSAAPSAVNFSQFPLANQNAAAYGFSQVAPVSAPLENSSVGQAGDPARLSAGSGFDDGQDALNWGYSAFVGYDAFR